MSGRFTLIVGIIAVIIIVPAVLFVINKNNNKVPVYSAQEEIAKFKNDKTITKTYFGTFPCADCTGIDTNLSLTQADVNASEGTFTLSQRYLGKDSDAVIVSGNWTTQRGDANDPDATVITLNPDDPEKIEFYLQVDPTHLEKLDKEENKMTPVGAYAMTLLE